MENKRITRLPSGYYLLEKDGQSLEISPHEAQMLREGIMMVTWGDYPGLKVKDIQKYQTIIREGKSPVVTNAENQLKLINEVFGDLINESN